VVEAFPDLVVGAGILPDLSQARSLKQRLKIRQFFFYFISLWLNRRGGVHKETTGILKLH